MNEYKAILQNVDEERETFIEEAQKMQMQVEQQLADAKTKIRELEATIIAKSEEITALQKAMRDSDEHSQNILTEVY